MFRAHPERAARLLSNIPRLEAVAEIIRGQQKPEAEPSRPAKVLTCSIWPGIGPKNLPGSRLPGPPSLNSGRSRRFDGRMLDALEGYSPQQAEFEVRRLPVRELRAGMVLEKDVLSKDGNLLILKGGTVLTDTWIERLENFAKTRGAQETLGVRVPSSRSRTTAVE